MHAGGGGGGAGGEDDDDGSGGDNGSGGGQDLVRTSRLVLEIANNLNEATSAGDGDAEGVQCSQDLNGQNSCQNAYWSETAKYTIRGHGAGRTRGEDIGVGEYDQSESKRRQCLLVVGENQIDNDEALDDQEERLAPRATIQPIRSI